MDRLALRPESTSYILRATHIVEVALEMVQASEWQAVSPRLEHREVHLELKLVEIHKGTTRWQPGSVAPMEAVQSRARIPREFSLPGVWSRFELTPGARFVIFTVAGEPPFKVEAAETAVPDLRRAQRAGVPELSLGETIAASLGELQNWAYLFAQYLEARLPESFYQRFDDFEVYLQSVEDPRLSAMARRMLIAAAYTKLMLYDPAPPTFINRLLETTALVLEAPYGASLREAVLETYLPNLLGITGGLERKRAADVLGAFPAARGRIEGFLANVPSVLAWLRP